jgi:hypothetical protein
MKKWNLSVSDLGSWGVDALRAGTLEWIDVDQPLQTTIGPAATTEWACNQTKRGSRPLWTEVQTTLPNSLHLRPCGGDSQIAMENAHDSTMAPKLQCTSSLFCFWLSILGGLSYSNFAA